MITSLVTKSKSILLVYTNYSSFVRHDFEILSTFSCVTKYQFNPRKGILNVFRELLRELSFLVMKGRRYDAYFIWFSDFHSLFPVLISKLYHKKSFVVIGGYDVSSMPEYGYGTLNNPIRRFFSTATFKYVDQCLPVANSLKEKLLKINTSAKCETIHTGYDPEIFFFGNDQREKCVLTVSNTDSYNRLMIKGLDRFKELALHLPEFRFIIIGIPSEMTEYFEPIPVNLELLPPKDIKQLIPYYQGASIYAQFSRTEGLPNALCEAMLCGCIPVGTNVGDIKDAILDTGLVVDEWYPEEVAYYIKENYNNIALRHLARAHIQNKFSNIDRQNRLKQLFYSN